MFLRLNYTNLLNATYFGICFGTTYVFLLRLAFLLLGTHSDGFPVLPLAEVPLGLIFLLLLKSKVSALQPGQQKA